ncbi:Protein of unknown function [Pyronema omphalodes CBS 100304]|uniref:Uncharacterized protein n=1 Tax=Pyronema omphalodes (strain CBS 100304) TaxID=1076935 RepID=U4LCY0_PYROM|nr:Protein of unknown function [Pyronema omphalodes CBS 100304]
MKAQHYKFEIPPCLVNYFHIDSLTSLQVLLKGMLSTGLILTGDVRSSMKPMSFWGRAL